MDNNQGRICRRWQYAAVISALLHVCLWIAVAFSFPRMENVEPLLLVDLPFSIILVVIGWNSPNLLIWFGLLGTLWWYLLVLFAGIMLRRFSVVELLPSKNRELIWRTIGAFWLLACILALISTLLLEGEQQGAFRVAKHYEALFMFILSFPSSLLFWNRGFEWLVEGGKSLSDLGQVIAIWVLYFVIGSLQWFVLVPWVIRKGLGLYDYVARQIRQRKMR